MHIPIYYYIRLGNFSFNHRNSIGNTNSVNTVDVIIPPMITHAMLTRVSEPALSDSAVGSMPTTIVSAVIKIGFRRVLPASITAAFAVMPSCISVSV